MSHPLSSVHRSRRAPRLAAIALALCTLALSAAQAQITGTLYEAPGYAVTEIAPGVLAPVGFVNPSLPYVLQNASSGGNAAGNGFGLGAARLSTGVSFLGQRGLVFGASGTTVLSTLGVNTVAGWTPQGFGSSAPSGASANGTVLGTSTLYSSDGTQNLGGRVVWYAAGSSMPQQLALPGGFTDSSGFGIANASAISAGGIAIGNAQQYQGDSSLGSRALRWNSLTGSAEVLDKLSGYSEWGQNNSSAVAVNSAGTVVGSGASYHADGSLEGFTAVRWNAGGTAATPLGHLGTDSSGSWSSRALAINNGGTVVGQSTRYDSAGNFLGEGAVRWDAGSTTAVELTGLTPNAQGESFTYATAINDSGMVMGTTLKFNARGDELGTRAVRWLPGSTQAQELALLAEGTTGESFSFAFGMNAEGYIAGMANTQGAMGNSPWEGEVAAVVWTPDGEVINLNSLLGEGSNWYLYSANGISDTGWVTGLGIYQPEGLSSQYAYERMFGMQLNLAPVPEPSPAALLALGLLGLAWRRRQTA